MKKLFFTRSQKHQCGFFINKDSVHKRRHPAQAETKILSAGYRRQGQCRRSVWQPFFLLSLIFLFLLTGSVFAKSGKARVISAKSKKAKTFSKVKGKGLNTTLFNKLADIAAKLGLDPDAVEITRYAIKQPAHFATVAEHAAAQDYPFFALVGAVKAAKNRNFPKVGTFTQAKCEMPITAIEEVFSKADSTINNVKGKQDTNSVTNAAKEYAAQYAAAQTASAKEQLIAELTKNIPYFGEIKTICSFGFETNLKIERDVQNAVSEKMKKLHRAYLAFNGGDYATGIRLLIELGASADIACEFLDSAVSGGVLGRIPILGSIGKGVCKNFTGKVFDAATNLVKGGIGLIEDGVTAAVEFGGKVFCTVFSLIGNGCSSAPAVPVSPFAQALNAAKSWCQTRGGLKNFMSKVIGEDVNYACNDDSQCKKKPGELMRCVTAQEQAAWNAQRAAQLQSDLKNKLSSDISEINNYWLPRCPSNDQKCKFDIVAVALQALKKIQAIAAAEPTNSYDLQIKVFPIQEANSQAKKIVHEAEFRVLPKKWEADFNSYWIPKCQGNQECVNKMSGIRFFALLAVTSAHKEKPDALYATMSPIYADGAKAAFDYFKTNIGGNTEERQKIIRTAVMNATGRPAHVIELIGYGELLKTGEINANGIYADALMQMNKFPLERKAMIIRGYLSAMGREPKTDELNHWQTRKESFREFIEAARNFLYTKQGGMDLFETVSRYFFNFLPKDKQETTNFSETLANFKANRWIYSDAAK